MVRKVKPVAVPKTPLVGGGRSFTPEQQAENRRLNEEVVARMRAKYTAPRIEKPEGR